MLGSWVGVWPRVTIEYGMVYSHPSAKTRGCTSVAKSAHFPKIARGVDPPRKQCSARIRFGVVSTGILQGAKKRTSLWTRQTTRLVPRSNVLCLPIDFHKSEHTLRANLAPFAICSCNRPNTSRSSWICHYKVATPRWTQNQLSKKKQST